MRFRLLMVTMAVFIITAACNRFDNTFKPQEIDTSFDERIEFFGNELTDALQSTVFEDIMTFYSDDYLYDGRTKADVETFYTGLANSNPDSISVIINNIDRNALRFSYRITLYRNAGLTRSTLLDTTIVEFTNDKAAGYLIVGNGQEGTISPDKKVLVELFTATWCPNCPYVEAALHNLKQQHSDRFYYLEYHRMDPFDFGNADIYNYYGIPSLPTSVIGGTTRITGGSETGSLPEYQYAISQQFGQEAAIFLNDFSYTVTADSIAFSIEITIENGGDNLQVKYALLEKESSTNNAAGQPLRNVVIRKGDKPLPGSPNSVQTVELSFAKPNFSFNIPAILVWVQTIETPYNSETCIVHNVQEYPITISQELQ